MTKVEIDDPHDDCTHWLGSLSEEGDNSKERTAKRIARRTPEPDVLSEELGPQTQWQD